MNRIQIPEGMGLEQFGLMGMSSLGRKSKSPFSKLRKLHKAIKAKTMPHAMMKAKKKKKKRGEPAEGAVAPSLTSWTVTGTDSEGQQFSESYPDQATAQAAASASIAGGATGVQVVPPSAPTSAAPYTPGYQAPYTPGSTSPAPAPYSESSAPPSAAIPDVHPTQTGPQQSAAPTGPPPMPGYPQDVTAEPEGAPAQSSEEASEGEPAAGERGGEEGGEAEGGGEEAPEQEEAEEAPPEESEAAEAPAAEEAPASEEAGTDGVGEFSARRLALRLPPPLPAKPIWKSEVLDRVLINTRAQKLSGLSQTGAPKSESGILPVLGLVVGIGAVAGLIYYLKKVKKT